VPVCNIDLFCLTKVSFPLFGNSLSKQSTDANEKESFVLSVYWCVNHLAPVLLPGD
jgi:hypothetical protein